MLHISIYVPKVNLRHTEDLVSYLFTRGTLLLPLLPSLTHIRSAHDCTASSATSRLQASGTTYLNPETLSVVHYPDLSVASMCCNISNTSASTNPTLRPQKPTPQSLSPEPCNLLP